MKDERGITVIQKSFKLGDMTQLCKLHIEGVTGAAVWRVRKEESKIYEGI